VLILNEGQWFDKANNGYIGTTRIKLLGVLSSGPLMTADGTITVEDIPTAHTPIAKTQLMMHLGYIIKAKEILTLGDHIKLLAP